MAGVHHIACPSCGGVISVSEVDRVTSCGYCRVRLLIEGAEVVPEYWIEPRIDEEDAKRALLDAMRGPDMPPGLVRRSRPHAAQLHFVPYNETHARRLGTITLSDASLVDEEPSPRGSRTPSLPTTRVVMGDIHRLEPALELPGWGLEERGYAAIAHEQGDSKLPLDRRRASAYGTILRPTRSASRSLDELRPDGRNSSFRDDTAFTEVRVQRVYYPIWRLKYRYAGRLWSATFDAVTGALMAARMPLGDSRRILWFVGSASFVGFALGKICAVVSAILGVARNEVGSIISNAYDYAKADPGGVGPALALAVLIVIVVVGLLAYEQFRYPQELVVDGAKRDIVRVGGPSKTLLDRFFGLLDGMPWNRTA
jgi:hypothetical protein